MANEAGLSALAEEMSRAGRGRAGRRRNALHAKPRHRIRRVGVIGLVVVLLIVAGGAGYTYYLAHDLKREEVKGLTGALTTGKEAGTENILMVGSTSRCALTVQNPAYGLCSQGVNGVNSDVIMILHVDPANHRLGLLSIPRDLFIPNARSTGANKVDAGLFQGLTQLVSAIEEDFGIPIQHTVSLNFDQFANVVDALGGINMAFPMSVFDASSGLNVQAATCVHLNGTQALEVVRARHLQYKSATTTSTYAENWPQESLSDLARIRRDHEFLRVLAAAVAKQGLGNPIADLNLINSVKADLTFDQTWPATDMANMVLDFHTVNVNSVPQLTLPVEVVTDPAGAGGGLVYKGGSYGDVEFPTQAQDQSAIDQVLGIGAGIDSMNGKPLPARSSVSVSVVNGTGAYNQASTTSAALAALGFHMVGRGRCHTRRRRRRDGRVLRIQIRGRRSRRPGGHPGDDRLGHHGLRPEPGDRRGRCHRGHRHPVRSGRPRGPGDTLHRRRRCPRRLRPDDGSAVTDHDADDLPRCQRHRRAVTDHVHARAVGPPGLPAGGRTDSTGGQSDLTTVARALRPTGRPGRSQARVGG